VTPLGRGDRLPDLSLPSLPGGEPFALRTRGREGRVVVLLEGAGCARCREYAAALAAARETLEEWRGLVLLVLPGTVAEAERWREESATPFRVLADPEGRLAAAAGVRAPALLVSDQWGELFLVEEGGAEHRLSPPGEVAEWLRYLAIQCAG
jgi:peroxiredoxin